MRPGPFYALRLIPPLMNVCLIFPEKLIWVAPGPVLLKNYYRTSKYQPIVNEVELIDANPSYAKIRYQDGSEANVSI